jgi:hypothetical protein
MIHRLQKIVVDFCSSKPNKTFNKGIAKELAAFERNILRRVLLGVNENRSYR